MKATTPPSENDPILTAYVLDELPRDEAAQLTAQLSKAGNQSLRDEVESIDTLSNLLSEGLNSGDSLKLSPSQRSAIFQSAKTPTAADVESTYKKQWLRPVLVSLGAAAAVTIAVVTLQNMDAGKENMVKGSRFDDLNDRDLVAPITPSDKQWVPSDGAREVSSGAKPADNGSINSIENGFSRHPIELRDEMKKKATAILENSDTKVVEISENSWVMRADNAMSRLPLVTGNSSWQWIQQWSKSTGSSASKSIDPNLVCIDEIINNFDFTSPADVRVGDIQLGVELVKCPWNKDHYIAAVLVQNRSDDSAQVEAAVTMAEAVSQYRLIGYAKPNQQTQGKSAPERISMAKGYSHLVLYEIQLDPATASGADVLRVSLRATDTEQQNTENSLSIQHSNIPWQQATQDVQFSLILASWAQVLAGSKLDSEMTADGVTQLMEHFTSNHTPTQEQANAMSSLKAALKRAL